MARLIFSALLLWAACCQLISVAVSYNNGMGAKPPMGWNTWCTDDVCGLLDICTEKEIMSVADAIVSQGLDKYGYKFVNLDDCWSDTSRDADGNLQPNPQQFPSGMKALADYIHSKGLYLGVYTCVGTKTCKRGRPGSFGYYKQDAQTLASWGVDFVKADNCNRPDGYTEQIMYSNFSTALNETGRPILFSLCEWGDSNVSTWGAEYGQMFRIQMDHLPFYSFPGHGASGAGFGQGVLDIIDYVGTLKPSTFVRQYGWMDPDFLETLFRPTMDFPASRVEYSFWSFWSAPLIIATELRNLTDEKASIILNQEVIAINQDDSNTAGDLVANFTNGGQVWARELQNGDKAVLLFNPDRHNSSASIPVSVEWSKIGWSSTSKVSLRDVWQHEDLGTFTGFFNATLAPKEVVYLRATESSRASRE